MSSRNHSTGHEMPFEGGQAGLLCYAALAMSIVLRVPCWLPSSIGQVAKTYPAKRSSGIPVLCSSGDVDCVDSAVLVAMF